MNIINGLCIVALAALLSLFFIEPNAFSKLSFVTPSKPTLIQSKSIIDSDLDGWSDEDEKHCQTVATDNTSTPLDSDNDGICDNLDKPIIITRPKLLTNSHEPYHYEVKAIDLDNAELSYSLKNAPEGMSIEGNMISWVPPIAGSNDEEKYSFSVVVSDGHVKSIQDINLMVIQSRAHLISDSF